MSPPPRLVRLDDRTVPATFFVDPDFPGNPGDAVTFNPGEPGETGGLTLGTDAFRTLAEALQAADATAEADVVRLAATPTPIAVDNTAGPVVVAGEVALVGSGRSLTRLVPTEDTADGFTAVLQADGPAGRLTVRGLTFDGAGFDVGVAVFVGPGAVGLVEDATIANVAFPASFDGFAVAASGGDVTVRDSVLTAYGRAGVSVVGGSATVAATTITGAGRPDVLNYGVQAFDGAAVLVTGSAIAANTGGVAGAASAGVFVSTLPPADPAVVTLVGNAVAGNAVGLLVGDGTADDPSVVVAGYNRFVGNGTGVAAELSGVAVDARFNWWGDPTGPTSPTLNPGGRGDAVVGNVRIDGFLSTPLPVAVAASVADYAARFVPVPVPTPVPPPTAPPVGRFAVGAGSGGGPRVSVFDGTGTRTADLLAFDPGFVGGVRPAVADVTGDGVPDVVAAAGPGGATAVVLDGVTGAVVAVLRPFEGGYAGGLFTAAADFDRDGFAEVVLTADAGGGTRVMVFSGAAAARGQARVVADFLGLPDPTFRGGLRPAVGDLTGDGVPDLILAAGVGGGPRVAVWDGASVLSGGRLVADFFAFEPTARDGAFVAAGDLTDDGVADLILAAGPRLRVADGAAVVAAGFGFALDDAGRELLTLASVFVGDPSVVREVRVTARDLDGDGRAEVVAAGGTAVVRVFAGGNLLDPAAVLDPFGVELPGGVFVG